MTAPAAADRTPAGAAAAETPTAPTAAQVIAALDLEYLPGEGVYIKHIWRNQHGNAIYCLLTPQDFSALHVLNEHEMWVHVAGAPAQMLLLHPDHTHTDVTLGTNLAAPSPAPATAPATAQHPVVCVAPQTWQAARTLGPWTLVVCSLTPPFSAFTLADHQLDLTPWGPAAQLAREFIRGECT
jgi:predicted cupin superfamily sugar epimerase